MEKHRSSKRSPAKRRERSGAGLVGVLFVDPDSEHLGTGAASWRLKLFVGTGAHAFERRVGLADAKIKAKKTPRVMTPW